MGGGVRDPRPERAVIRVVTWNVLWWFDPQPEARQRGIRSIVADLAPDIVGLQECWASAETTQADAVAEVTGGHAAFVATSLPPVPPEDADRLGMRMGIGLVCRWPITATEAIELPVTHRQVPPVALVASVEHPSGPLSLVVAATEWEPEYADDHRAQTKRLARLIEELARAGRPVMLLADLNADASQVEFAPLAEVASDTWERGGGMTDAVTLSSAVPFAPLEATKQIDRRVDHILTRPALEVERAFLVDRAVDGMYPSDHFPVVADVVLERMP
ncbi:MULTISPECIES: endonuclease/exonuclease/phosphatase family protein [unclassified Leifsonia]|uniref:endonuclease/exonuclease/phosphatase family protein n=1 Tax=unclassified Leifsonia TaxID=2663824 RepID=UPI0007014971|nr:MULTISPECIES: endonuclease/exonuclease/phosphatase family protein [unclassified Leifsonia]KQX08166.1 hypothetical protein ASC59_10875 [Leifsonia sp. Root1293]KRA12447.1 hypothetical protein ASD61_10875 [Leifsonia sp. Root60]